MTLTINNKSSFLRFLIAASGLYDQCIMHCSKSNNLIDVFVSTESEQVILYSEYSNVVVSDDTTLNIPDIKKLIKLIGYIPCDVFTLDITNNSIVYSTTQLSFKYHLYEDGIIRVKKINKDMLKQFQGEYTFNLSTDDIDRLIKSNSILGTNEFVYIKGVQGKIICELTDKKIANTDSITLELCDTNNSSISFNEMKFNIESIRLLTTLKCQYITCKLHTKYNCIVTLSRVDDCIGYFSIAALV